ncbi:MAG: hypothetical protein AAF633_00360 [Chloroflexota bacterium]
MNTQKLNQLNTAIDNSYMLLDLEGEALSRTERGALYAQAEQWREAAFDFGRVAEIAEMVDQTQHAAQAYITQGNMFAQAQLWDQANKAYGHGADLYVSVGLYLLAAQALRQVAAYHVWQKMTDQALVILQKAIDMLDPHEPEEAALLIKLYETLTQLYWSLGRFEAARTVMLDANEAVGHYAEMGPIADRQQIMQRVISGEISLPEAWVEAMPMITEAGWVDPPLGEAILAYNNSSWEKVVQSAALSRQQSRTAMQMDEGDQQPLLRYLLASMLLADAQDKRGHRVSVLIALLTCRSVLTGRLGEAAGVSIDRVLDSMRSRWGDDGMATAVAGYQAYVQENGMLVA